MEFIGDEVIGASFRFVPFFDLLSFQDDIFLGFHSLKMDLVLPRTTLFELEKYETTREGAALDSEK